MARALYKHYRTAPSRLGNCQDRKLAVTLTPDFSRWRALSLLCVQPPAPLPAGCVAQPGGLTGTCGINDDGVDERVNDELLTVSQPLHPADDSSPTCTVMSCHGVRLRQC